MTQSKANIFTLITLLLVIFIDVMGIVLVFPILTPLILSATSPLLPVNTPLIMRDFLYGFTLAVFPLFMFFGAPILGELSDKLGRKKVLLICLFGTTLSYLISAVGIRWASLGLLLLGRSIAGAVAGTQPIAQAAIIDMSTDANKAQRISLSVMAMTLGILVGPLLGGITADKDWVSWFNFDTPFIVAAVIALLNALLLLFTFKETLLPKKSQVMHLLRGFTLFIAAFKQRNHRLLSSAFFLFVFSWALFFQVIAWLLMINFAYGPGKLGIFTGFVGLAFVIGSTVVMRLLLKVFSRQGSIFLLGITIMAFACVMSACFHRSEHLQWMITFLNACGDTICYTSALSLFSNSVTPDSQGWIMGVTSSLSAIAWVAAGVLAGPLGYIDIRLPFLIAGGAALLGFLCIYIYQAENMPLIPNNVAV